MVYTPSGIVIVMCAPFGINIPGSTLFFNKNPT